MYFCKNVKCWLSHLHQLQPCWDDDDGPPGVRVLLPRMCAVMWPVCIICNACNVRNVSVVWIMFCGSLWNIGACKAAASAVTHSDWVRLRCIEKRQWHGQSCTVFTLFTVQSRHCGWLATMCYATVDARLLCYSPALFSFTLLSYSSKTSHFILKQH